jgi:hypothetical protein
MPAGRETDTQAPPPAGFSRPYAEVCVDRAGVVDSADGQQIGSPQTGPERRNDGGCWLFVGWGAPVRGREAKGLEVFNEALAYYGRLQQEGVIEGFETVILEPHGGELAGFILLRGSEERLARLRVEHEFVLLSTRASLIVEGVGVVGVALGDGLEESIATYQQAVSELA